MCWLAPEHCARQACVAISEVKAELVQAEERDLTASVKTATATTLDRLAGSKAIGNSDSAALAAVLKRLGVQVDPPRSTSGWPSGRSAAVSCLHLLMCLAGRRGARFA